MKTVTVTVKALSTLYDLTQNWSSDLSQCSKFRAF